MEVEWTGNRTIGAQALESILACGLGRFAVMDVTAIIHLSDDDYLPLSGEYALELLGQSPELAPSGYLADVFDCDDFALCARARAACIARARLWRHPICLGIVQTRSHAMNFTVDGRGRLWLVDFIYRRTRCEHFERFLERELGHRCLVRHSLEFIYA